MVSTNYRWLALCLILLAPFPAGAAGNSLALSMHRPPALRPAAGKTSFALGAGWAGIRGPGLSLDGPGGGWEFAAASKQRLGGALHAEANALGGTMDASGAGRLKTVGMTGSIEGDVVWAPSGSQGPWRLYAGAQAVLSILDFTGARRIAGPSGSNVIEPSGAYSLLIGFPIGVGVGGDLGQGWTGQANAYVVTYAGGATVYRYFLPGTRLYGSFRKLGVHAAAGGLLRAEYRPWRAAVEAGVSAASRSGDSRGLTTYLLQASWRIF